MKKISISSFTKNIEKYLANIENTKKPLTISGNNDKGYIVLPESEYNSIIETLHLLSTKANAIALYKSVEQHQNSCSAK